MRTILYFLLFAIINPSAFALSNEELTVLFEKGNTAYREKKYAEAEVAYSNIVEAGIQSDAIEFNLGNSCFKQGKLGEAILHYERAKRLNPADEDIRFNLRMAYSTTVDKVEPIPLLIHEQWILDLLLLMAPDSWATLAVCLIWCTACLGLLYLFANTVSLKRNSFLSMLCMLGFAVIVYLIAYQADREQYGEDLAIVIDANASIKSTPDSKGTTLFMLHEGTRVEVVEQTVGWTEIRIANGNQGWIETGKIGII